MGATSSSPCACLVVDMTGHGASVFTPVRLRAVDNAPTPPPDARGAWPRCWRLPLVPRRPDGVSMYITGYISKHNTRAQRGGPSPAFWRRGASTQKKPTKQIPIVPRCASHCDRQDRAGCSNDVSRSTHRLINRQSTILEADERTRACKSSPASTPSSRPLVAVTPSTVLQSPALCAAVAANELGEPAQQVETGVTHVVEGRFDLRLTAYTRPERRGWVPMGGHYDRRMTDTPHSIVAANVVPASQLAVQLSKIGLNPFKATNGQSSSLSLSSRDNRPHTKEPGGLDRALLLEIPLFGVKLVHRGRPDKPARPASQPPRPTFWRPTSPTILDATTGQNDIIQARVFAEAIQVTGIVLTKLDRSANGGTVVAVQTVSIAAGVCQADYLTSAARFSSAWITADWYVRHRRHGGDIQTMFYDDPNVNIGRHSEE
ncbi:hypothetical protein QBC39DRAFT_437130 [Podospora conica]|nr:hypothetical protein QBC39DRAFT_437130 [Schizothecium conicum]